MKKQPQSAVQKQRSQSVIPKPRPSYVNIEPINPKKVPLTPEVLRTFEGFEQTSDAKASAAPPLNLPVSYWISLPVKTIL